MPRPTAASALVVGTMYGTGFGQTPEWCSTGGTVRTASGIVAARNQSLIEANGSDEENPTSSINSVPSTTPATNGGAITESMRDRRHHKSDEQ